MVVIGGEDVAGREEDGDIFQTPRPMAQLLCADVITGKLEVGAPGRVVSQSSRGNGFSMSQRQQNLIGVMCFAGSFVSVRIERIFSCTYLIVLVVLVPPSSFT